MDNLEETDKFLERYSLTRLNQEEKRKCEQTNHKHEIETVILKTPNKKNVQDLMASQANFIKHLEKS